MISKIPGWLNFIILTGIYMIPVAFLSKLTGMGLGALHELLICQFFSGAYLSKWREKPGGGLSFNGMTKYAWIVGGGLLLSMLAYVVWG